MPTLPLTIRKVGLRDFQRRFYTEIKDLPAIVTKNKEPYLMVMPYAIAAGTEPAQPSVQSGTPENPGFEQLMYKGMPVVLEDHTNEQPKQKPSLFDRLKRILNFKIL